MSHTCRSILDQVDMHAVDTAWQRCEEILTNMASFSLSARNSLQFLQVTHQYIMQNYKGTSLRLRTGASGLVLDHVIAFLRLTCNQWHRGMKMSMHSHPVNHNYRKEVSGIMDPPLRTQFPCQKTQVHKTLNPTMPLTSTLS
jgi:hypothetical protein